MGTIILPLTFICDYPIRTDVSKSSDIQALVKKTVETYGQLDFAVNNAGIGGPSVTTSDYPEEDWNRVIGINLTGVWLCMKYELEQMVKQGHGAIVNMASVLGWVGFATAPAYSAAKHGVIGLTKTAAIEYAEQNIRINTVCPGFIATPLLEEAGMAQGTDAYNTIASLHPMKLYGQARTSGRIGAVVMLGRGIICYRQCLSSKWRVRCPINLR